MKSIPLEQHTVETLMSWAKIVTEVESKRAAAAIYKEVVKYAVLLSTGDATNRFF
jgi:hypothetical protein